MQITNSDGDIKCIDAKGNIKWLAPIVANNEKLLKSYGISVFSAPEKIEFKTEPKEISEEKTEQVAETAPAKRGRKTTNK